MIDRKPWLEYPEYWKTEAEFWSYLRGALRRGLWEKSPIKLGFKNKACSPPPEGYTGRAKSGAECALTGEWINKSALEVDHCEGHVSLRCWEDVLDFICHLVPPRDSLQLVGKEAHKIKSYAERMGMTFQDAQIEKIALDLIKKKMDVDWLDAKGVVPASSQAKRRVQITDLLKEGMNSES